MIATRAFRRPPLPLDRHRERRLRLSQPCRGLGVDVSQFEGVLDADTSYAVVYGGLGLAATSFAATFFVAPNFKSELKEAEDWKQIFTQLVAKETTSITPLQAAAKLSTTPRPVLLDVRLASRFERDSAEGSINIPLYQPIEAFTFFGIPGTERNPIWLPSVEAAVAKDQEVIVLCEMGGTLETKIGMETGFQSRSLKAVHFLQEAGYKNISHMKGGISEWKREGLPMLESP